LILIHRGRVALAMQQISFENNNELMTQKTKYMFLSADIRSVKSTTNEKQRILKDDFQAQELISTTNCLYLMLDSNSSLLEWTGFLNDWYGASIWGSIQKRRPAQFQKMLQCKASNLKKRSQDLAYILRTCSPSRNSFRKSVF